MEFVPSSIVLEMKVKVEVGVHNIRSQITPRLKNLEKIEKYEEKYYPLLIKMEKEKKEIELE